jgi:hypothetical protein
VYAPCRWSYRYVAPPSTVGVRRYLLYLFLVYCVSLPFLLYKNYLYFQYIQSHGGDVVFFSDYANIAANVPLVVRLIALLPLPVLVLLFVLETRMKLLTAVVASYFADSIALLLTRTRMGPFKPSANALVCSPDKVSKPSRLWRLALLAAVLVIVANLTALARFGEDVEGRAAIDPVTFIATQGGSLGVTEVAVMRPEVFRPTSFPICSTSCK